MKFLKATLYLQLQLLKNTDYIAFVVQYSLVACLTSNILYVLLSHPKLILLSLSLLVTITTYLFFFFFFFF